MFTRGPTCLVWMIALLLAACGEATAADRPAAPSGAGLSVGGHHACRLTADGHALCWGLDDAGSTWCWGDGSSGELGTDLDATAVPVRVGGA